MKCNVSPGRRRSCGRSSVRNQSTFCFHPARHLVRSSDRLDARASWFMTGEMEIMGLVATWPGFLFQVRVTPKCFSGHFVVSPAPGCTVLTPGAQCPLACWAVPAPFLYLTHVLRSYPCQACREPGAAGSSGKDQSVNTLGSWPCGLGQSYWALLWKHKSSHR